jgi:hypothetical protein
MFAISNTLKLASSQLEIDLRKLESESSSQLASKFST